MSKSSPSLLLLDEPALKVPTMPTPPPQPGEHNMHRRSQGIEPPRSLLNAHLRRHINIHLDDGKFPNIATPVQTPDNMLLALAPTDGGGSRTSLPAKTFFFGGRPTFFVAPKTPKKQTDAAHREALFSPSRSIFKIGDRQGM